MPEAHKLAHGTGIRVAVINSGIDTKHRELAGSIVDSFDALASSEGPHVHGTGIAGAIAAHARLMGSAPAAELVAIRAFSGTANGAQSNSWVILKALDYAARRNARIINMSFAGPKDPLVERGINAEAARGIVMVAAAGNAGAKSPPLYPAANPNVIAVSATDAQDHLFQASNRGSHIAVAAPGADVFLPAPDEKYQMTSGTSFAAAYVSGVAALMLERNPALRPDELRAVMIRTARDLGSPGRDDLFGAGEADAYAAVEAVSVPPPVASSAPAARQNGAENAREPQEIPPVRALTPTMASEKPARQPAARSNSSRKNPPPKVKKFGRRFEPGRGPRATNVCGSGNSLPMAISGASAHPPQAPIWLDPSGCPPGRVFLFGARSRESDPVWEFVSKQRTSLDSHNVFHKILLSPCS